MNIAVSQGAFFVQATALRLAVQKVRQRAAIKRMREREAKYLREVENESIVPCIKRHFAIGNSAITHLGDFHLYRRDLLPVNNDGWVTDRRLLHLVGLNAGAWDSTVAGDTPADMVGHDLEALLC